MNLKTAKEYFHLGLIQSATIQPPVMKETGYTLRFSGNIGNAFPNLETHRGHVREFATVDAVAKVLQDIGIQSATLHLSAGGAKP